MTEDKRNKILWRSGVMMLALSGAWSAYNYVADNADDKNPKPAEQTEQTEPTEQAGQAEQAGTFELQDADSQVSTGWEVSFSGDHVIAREPYVAMQEHPTSNFASLQNDMAQYDRVNSVDIKSNTGEESVTIIPEHKSNDVELVLARFMVGNHDVTYGVNLVEGTDTSVSVDGEYHYKLDGEENTKFTEVAKGIKTGFEEGTLTGDDVSKFVEDTKANCNTTRLYDEIGSQTSNTDFPGSLLLSMVFGKNKSR